MTALPHPLIVVSDTHLGPEAPARLAHDLGRLVREGAGHEIILAGDVFDLSFARTGADSRELLRSLLDAAPEVVQALHAHVSRGDPLTIIAGNHDAALIEDGVRDVFLGKLSVARESAVRVERWFVRRGGVHVEHGHVYDPDNAPIHPLVEWSDRTEPLGIALTRRFVAGIGAGHYAHRQDTTPVKALTDAFRIYGRQAPGMIARYFRTAIGLCLEAGPRRAPLTREERLLGESRVRAFAAEAGLAESSVRALLSGAPPPTHLSRTDVFYRLYFDRVLATLLFGASLTFSGRPTALATALGSAAYLAGSIARGRDRSAGMPARGLREAAARIRGLVDARTVVFGHTHVEDEAEGYLNSGSFAFPRALGRPYVAVSPNGQVERRRLAAL